MWSWQPITLLCTSRAVGVVAAIANPSTGVAVYDSYGESDWLVFGGTSATSPIVASIYARRQHVGRDDNRGPVSPPPGPLRRHAVPGDQQLERATLHDLPVQRRRQSLDQLPRDDGNPPPTGPAASRQEVPRAGGYLHRRGHPGAPNHGARRRGHDVITAASDRPPPREPAR